MKNSEISIITSLETAIFWESFVAHLDVLYYPGAVDQLPLPIVKYQWEIFCRDAPESLIS